MANIRLVMLAMIVAGIVVVIAVIGTFMPRSASVTESVSTTPRGLQHVTFPDGVRCVVAYAQTEGSVYSLHKEPSAISCDWGKAE